MQPEAWLIDVAERTTISLSFSDIIPDYDGTFFYECIFRDVRKDMTLTFTLPIYLLFPASERPRDEFRQKATGMWRRSMSEQEGALTITRASSTSASQQCWTIARGGKSYRLHIDLARIAERGLRGDFPEAIGLNYSLNRSTFTTDDRVNSIAVQFDAPTIKLSY